MRTILIATALVAGCAGSHATTPAGAKSNVACSIDSQASAVGVVCVGDHLVDFDLAKLEPSSAPSIDLPAMLSKNLARIPESNATALTIVGSNVKSLDGVEKLSHLRQISITPVDGLSLEPLAQLTELHSIRLGVVGKGVDLAPLAKLPGLQVLHLEGKPITGLEAFKRAVPGCKVELSK